MGLLHERAPLVLGQCRLGEERDTGRRWAHGGEIVRRLDELDGRVDRERALRFVVPCSACVQHGVAGCKTRS